MLALIFNPAKNTRQFEKATALLDREGIDYQIYETGSRDDIGIQTRRAIDDGSDMVASCGGDGTLLWVINEVQGTDIPVAVIPIGCSNDFAKQIGIHSVDDAVRSIAAAECMDVDLGECVFNDDSGAEQTLRFNSSAGLGIMPNIFALERFAVVKWAKTLLKDGIWPILCVHALIRTKAVPARVTIDEETHRAPLPLVEITKTEKNGGLAFVESATPTSGLLHSWRIESRSRMAFLRAIARVITGKPSADGEDVFEAASREIEIVPDRPQPVHLNGDLVGQTPVTFRMADASIPFVAPPT